MAFSQELDDFASGFSKGYDMVESKDERAQGKARTRYMEAQSTLLESQTTPEALAAAADRLDIEIDTARQNLLDLKDPVKRERAARDAESLIQARDIVTKINELNYKIEADPRNQELKRQHAEQVARLDELNLDTAGVTNETSKLALRKAQQGAAVSDAMFKSLEPLLNRGTQPLNEAVPVEGGGGPAAGGVTFEPPAVPEVDIPLEDREQIGEVPPDRPRPGAVSTGTDEPLSYMAEEPPRERYGLSPGELEGSDMTPAQQAIENFLNGNLTSAKDKKNAIIDGAKEGTKAGLNYLAEQNGLNQDHAVATPEVEQQHESFLTGAQGADSEAGQMAMDMVNQAAGGDLTLDEQATYTLGIGYLWHLATGDPETAAKYAASMVGFNQRLASQYSVFGQAAIANGDISAANEAIMRAYAHVTNGESLHITPTEDGRFNATITDMKTGKTRHEQIMTPDEIGAMASGVSADSYVKIMSQAAGIPDKTISDEAAILLGLTKGIKDPEMAIKLFGNLTTQEFNSLTMSEKAAGAQGAAAAKAAAEDEEKRRVKPTDMDDIEKGVDAAITKITDANPNAFGKAGETFANQEELMAAGDVADYSEQIKTVATDLMTNPDNYGKGLSATEAVKIARTLAEKRPEDLDIDPENNQVIRIYVRGHPTGLTMDRQRYNDIGLVRSYKDAIQREKDTADTKRKERDAAVEERRAKGERVRNRPQTGPAGPADRTGGVTRPTGYTDPLTGEHAQPYEDPLNKLPEEVKRLFPDTGRGLQLNVRPQPPATGADIMNVDPFAFPR